MNPDTIGALFLATIAVGLIVGCLGWWFVNDYAHRRVDEMVCHVLGPESPPFVDYLFDDPAFVDSTPIYTATIQHIAALEAANLDAEWEQISDGRWGA
jgi:hypothetical protein